MHYMVIETFKPGCTEEIYRRFHSRGRMLPAGLDYLDSWVSADRTRCFQLMEAADESLFQSWIEPWQDLTDFEVIPVSPTRVVQSETA